MARPTAMAARKAEPSGLPVQPMLATPAEAAPHGDGWVFEPKLDGYRLIAYLSGDAKAVHLFTRSGRDVTDEFTGIAPALLQIAAKAPELPLVLDGELVVQQASEAPQFQAMQRFRDVGAGTLRYYVFDLLRVGALDLTQQPLGTRRSHLERLLRGTRRPAGVIRLMPRLAGPGPVALRKAVGAGYEGLVAKRADGMYHSGRRSSSWLKLKRVETEDLVVGGFTRGRGRRARTLGALLVGNATPAGLVYAGHVGTGYNDRTLASLVRLLEPLRTPTCPFIRRPPLNDPAVWVRPEVVVEVRYAQRTHDQILRAPVFVRVRDDKTSTETVSIVRHPAVAKARASQTKSQAREPIPIGASRDVRAVIRQLDQIERDGTLEAGRVALRVSNLDKPLWPATPSKRMRRRATASLTKRDLLRYLALVSPALLRHLHHRPVTLTRYPDGAGKPGFYQRHWEGVVPPYIKTVALPIKDAGEDREYLLLESLAALLHAGQLGALELHPWYLRVGSDRPDFVVFDIDSYVYAGHERAGEEPAPHAAGFAAARQAAWLLKEELDKLELPSFVKTSGKTGLHIFVPIRRLSFDQTHALARTISEHLEKRHPKLLTTSWAVTPRRGKVFLDYNQNARSKTLAAAYSPRAAAGAPVSTPIEWDELDAVEPALWTIQSVPERLAKRGDPWAHILRAPVDLGARLRAA